MKVSNKKIIIAEGRSVKSNKTVNIELTLSELFNQLSKPIIRHNKDGKYFVYGKIDGSRQNDNVVEMYCASLDIDDSKLTLNALKRKVPDYCYHLHTTFSHKAEKKGNRYRIIFPYKNPLSVDDHIRAVKYLANSMDLPEIDSSSFKASQPFYLPACPRKREKHFKSSQIIDTDLFELTPNMLWEANQEGAHEASGYDIKEAVYKGDRDNEMTRYIGRLVHYNLPLDMIEQLTSLYNTKFTPPLATHDINRIINSVRKAEKNNNDYSNFVFVRPRDKVLNLTNKTMMPTAAFARGKYDNVDSLIKSGKLIEVDNIIYMPSEDIIFNFYGIKYANIYIPPNIKPLNKVPKIQPMYQHFKYLIPERNERKILLWFISYQVQNPGRKIRWMPIIKGGKGIGKSLIVDLIIKPLLGVHNVAPLKASLLVNSEFNGHIGAKMLHCIHELDDENIRHKEKIINELKELISDDTYQGHSKGLEAETISNTANFMAFTNKEDIVVITPDERRIVMIRSEASPKEEKYYKELAEWLKDHESIRHMYSFFLNRTLSKEISPNTLPITAYTQEIKDSSRSPLQNILTDIIEDYHENDIHVVAQSLLIKRVTEVLNRQNLYPTAQEISTAFKAINGFIHNSKVRISINKERYVPAVLPNKEFKPEIYYRNPSLTSEMRTQIRTQIKTDNKRSIESDF